MMRLVKTVNKICAICKYSTNKQPYKLRTTCEHFSSKNVRDLFLKYFIQDKNHAYIPSSPVFLHNDPSLLFVNAGMNQFRSVLLNKTYPGHPFQNLKRAANSQKCIRLSGKHNDLEDVGLDLYHHTFFEMLGNWSFGDYSKMETCKMAWELLTNIYGLHPDNLYVTYFGGDKQLQLPADLECKNIWLEIGLHPTHIFPFGAQDNFWEMGDKGPCGPCTEIHYDFLNSGSEAVAQKLNSGSHDVMEIWNLVFIQYNRESESVLKKIPVMNIDTGMGFERLTAILQGSRSNYDTDIFSSLFEAIESNFKVRPYLGRTRNDDTDGLDTAYRILADHTRMFSASIADGMFPDSVDAGHVLRKIIRRAAYAANSLMKTRPGELALLVPHVAEILDFYPEIGKNVDEIIRIVNEEEKLFHQIINRGRKVRNKMISSNNRKMLSGAQVHELHDVYGLETNIVQDLAAEINAEVDWNDYEQVKNKNLADVKGRQLKKPSFVDKFLHQALAEAKPFCNDSFKYKYSTQKDNYGVEKIKSTITGVFFPNKEDVPFSTSERIPCILMTKESNFYSEAGGQVSDKGKIYNAEFQMDICHVITEDGHVFHCGTITDGDIKNDYATDVILEVNNEHRMACSQNHTATHILNSALRKVLPYTAQRSSFVGPKLLKFGFSAKSPLTKEQLQEIENHVCRVIQKKMVVSRIDLSFEELINQPNVVLLRGEEYPENVSVISISDDSTSQPASIEPCCGTHVHNTADIEDFVLLPSKSQGSSVKTLSAATGNEAFVVRKNGILLKDKIIHLKQEINLALQTSHERNDVFLDLLKKVKAALTECHLKRDVPLLELRECEVILNELKMKLSDIVVAAHPDSTNDTVCVSRKKRNALNVVKDLLAKNIQPTKDEFKYLHSAKGIESMSAQVLAVVKDGKIVGSVERGLQCQFVLDKTNFFAEDDDQTYDIGILRSDKFVVQINEVYKHSGIVFHDGFVKEGSARSQSTVNLEVNEENRIACSRNHTALHLLNAVLKQKMPYFYPHSSSISPKEFQLNFTSKNAITEEELLNIEKAINDYVTFNLRVESGNELKSSLTDILPYKISFMEEYLPEQSVPTVVIGEPGGEVSKEPCRGTHVKSTSDIGPFILVSHKTVQRKERIIRAVTGEQALQVQSQGEAYNNSLVELENFVVSCLEKPQVDYLELWDCLRALKEAKVFHDTDLPLVLFRRHQRKLDDLTKQLTEVTHPFIQEGFQQIKLEMEELRRNLDTERCIVHHLKSTGDGKKIINFAIENSERKPALYFVKDGRKSIICTCSVPKTFVSPSFSALLWINPVATLLEGQARSLPVDPELSYSVVSKRTDKVEEAVELAKKFVRCHFVDN